MTDLSRFADGSFDVVFHPVSNVFIPDVRPVWRECARVLCPGGALLAGICNPLVYLFDWTEHAASGSLVPRYSIPYSDVEQRPRAELETLMTAGEPLEFGHTLEDQIGGQLDAGLVLTALYEDTEPDDPLGSRIPTFIGTRAARPAT